MTFRKNIVALTAIVGGLFLANAETAQASHFRYGHLTWIQRPDLGANTAELTLTAAFRRDAYVGTAGDGRPQTGDVITEIIGATGLVFGDGGFTGTLNFVITAYSPSENWLIGRGIIGGGPIIHTYPAPTDGGAPWLTRVEGCCRISSLQNCNDCAYRVESAVRFDIANSSPVSGLPPIVNVPINTVASFFVPGLDNEGDALTWRFSTSTESGITDEIGPGGIPDATNAPTINPATGQVTWNTTGGTAIGNLFTMSVRIDESRGAGIIGNTTVDFILLIVAAGVNDPPVCDIDPPGPFLITEGDSLTFDVTGTDPNALDTLTLNTGGLPAGATMTPGLPLAGPASGVTSTFNWMTMTGDAGAYVVSYSVTDNGGQQTLCTASIEVQPPAPVPAVSEWGLLVLTLIGLIVGTTMFGRKQPTA